MISPVACDGDYKLLPPETTMRIVQYASREGGSKNSLEPQAATVRFVKREAYYGGYD